jgi:uncharacterized protein (DUF433 family)
MHSCAPPVARKGAAAPASLRTHEATCPDPPATRLQSWLFAADRARCALEIKERLDRPSRHGEDVDWITVDRRIGLQLDFTATMCKALARAKVVDAADELITRSTVTGGKPCFKRTRLPIEPVLSSLEKGIPEDHVLDEYSLTSEPLTVAQVEAAISCGRRTHGPDVWRSCAAGATRNFKGRVLVRLRPKNSLLPQREHH